MDESKKSLTLSTKVAIISLIVGFTLGYSVYQKKKVEKLTSSENNLILKQMPAFSFDDLYSEGIVSNENIFQDGSKAVLIHFWGTWCAPCESELPEFINFVKKLEQQKVRAILLAVQDDDTKIKKFLKKFNDIPANVKIVHDKEGKSMINFGTVKVPETYLFSSNGKNLNKYIGPQNWSQKSVHDRLNFYLSSMSDQVKKGKIETH